MLDWTYKYLCHGRPKSICIRFTCQFSHCPSAATQQRKVEGICRTISTDHFKLSVADEEVAAATKNQTPGTDVARKKHRIRLESDKSWPVSAILKFHSVPFRLPSSFQMHSTLPDYSLYPNLSVRVVCQYLAGLPNIQLSVQKILAI